MERKEEEGCVDLMRRLVPTWVNKNKFLRSNNVPKYLRNQPSIEYSFYLQVATICGLKLAYLLKRLFPTVPLTKRKNMSRPGSWSEIPPPSVSVFKELDRKLDVFLTVYVVGNEKRGPFLKDDGDEEPEIFYATFDSTRKRVFNMDLLYLRETGMWLEISDQLQFLQSHKCFYCQQFFRSSARKNYHLKTRCRFTAMRLPFSSLPDGEESVVIGKRGLSAITFQPNSQTFLKESFSVSPFRPKMSLEEEFRNLGLIDVPPNCLRYSSFATLDCEAFTSTPGASEEFGFQLETSCTSTKKIHSLACVAVASNLDGFRLRIFTNDGRTYPTTLDLLSDLLIYLNLMSDTARKSYLFDVSKYIGLLEECAESARLSGHPFLAKKSENLKKKIEKFARKFPIVTFNGSRYDIPLLRISGLFPLLYEATGDEEGDEGSLSIVKKGRNYLNMKNAKLLWVRRRSKEICGDFLKFLIF
jgi:hypothetical protein